MYLVWFEPVLIQITANPKHRNTHNENERKSNLRKKSYFIYMCVLVEL